MKKIVFYVRTNDFGMESFGGYNTLKDFYHCTTLSMLMCSRLHLLKPLETVLLTDENGKKMLIDNANVEIDHVKLVEDEVHTPLDLYANEFPALYVKPVIYPFIDFPVNVFNAELLCFNVHLNKKSDIELTKEILNKLLIDDPVFYQIGVALRTNNLNSLNNVVLGSANPEFFKEFSLKVAYVYKKLPKNISNKLFFEFIERVYLYYYAKIKKVKIEGVNPYIPEEDYFSFKYFLTERINVYLLGDKTNFLTLRAIEKYSREINPTLFINQ